MRTPLYTVESQLTLIKIPLYAVDPLFQPPEMRTPLYTVKLH